MSRAKKITVTLPENLLNEFDRLIMEDTKSRSDFIREAIAIYIIEKKQYFEKVKNGYMEMASLNIEISEMCFEEDIKMLKEYETKLSESDIPDDDDSEKRRYILC
ncbi:MAG: CopG family ribbon-helix-helix protein [Clostridiaceae bacterium]